MSKDLIRALKQEIAIACRSVPEPRQLERYRYAFRGMTLDPLIAGFMISCLDAIHCDSPETIAE